MRSQLVAVLLGVALWGVAPSLSFSPLWANPYMSSGRPAVYKPKRRKPRRPATRPAATSRPARTRPPARRLPDPYALRLKQPISRTIPKELRGTMEKAVAALEQKQYKKALVLLMPPHLLASVRQQRAMGQLLAVFRKRLAPRLLWGLKHALRRDPVMAKGGTVAKFRVPPYQHSPPRMVFEKRGERWSLRDR